MLALNAVDHGSKSLTLLYFGTVLTLLYFGTVLTLLYFGTVLTVLYSRTVLTVLYFRTVLTVLYFGTVLTLLYFRTVLTVLYFLFFPLLLHPCTVFIAFFSTLLSSYLLTLPLFAGVSRVRALSPAWTGSHVRETLISRTHLFLPHDIPPTKKSSTIKS